MKFRAEWLFYALLFPALTLYAVYLAESAFKAGVCWSW